MNKKAYCRPDIFSVKQEQLMDDFGGGGIIAISKQPTPLAKEIVFEFEEDGSFFTTDLLPYSYDLWAEEQDTDMI